MKRKDRYGVYRLWGDEVENMQKGLKALTARLKKGYFEGIRTEDDIIIYDLDKMKKYNFGHIGNAGKYCTYHPGEWDYYETIEEVKRRKAL